MNQELHEPKMQIGAASMYVCMYVCLSLCLSVCMSVCLSVCLSVCMYVCMYVRTKKYNIYNSIYIYIFIYRHHYTLICDSHLTSPYHGLSRLSRSRAKGQAEVDIPKAQNVGSYKLIGIITGLVGWTVNLHPTFY